MSSKEELEKEIKKAQEGEIIQIKPSLTCKNGHEFVRVKNEARCVKCPIGYNLGSNTEIKDKHIYIRGQLVI